MNSATNTTDVNAGRPIPHSQATLPPHSSGWILGHGGVQSSTNLELALRDMNSIGGDIHDDLVVAKQEVATLGSSMNDNLAADLKELCKGVESKVEKYREDASKVMRLDIGWSTNSARITDDNTRSYQGRLRQILADIRRLRSGGTPCLTDSSHTIASGC